MGVILRTVKIEISDKISPLQRELIKQTAERYAVAYDIFAKTCCTTQTTDSNKIQAMCYKHVREMVPELPSAIVQACSSQACANVLAYNSNVARRNKNIKRKNTRRAKYAKRHSERENLCTPRPLIEEWSFNGQHKGMAYNVNTRSISRLENKGVTTVGTINGRVKIEHEIPQWFDKKYPEKRLYSGSISIGKFGEIYLYLVYALTKDGEDIVYSRMKLINAKGDEFNQDNVIGIDRGIYHPVACSNGMLVSSKPIYAVTRKYAHDVKELKQKSTSSARSRLRSLAGKQRLYRNDVNHCISKLISNIPNARCIVFENLTGISNRTTQSKKYNRWIHSWSFKDLEDKVTYKCEAKGIDVCYVNPQYTSQTCSHCGSVTKLARNKNHFCCPHCGYKEHADINAAKNIRDRHLVNRRNSLRVHSTTHDVPVELS